jgi:multidrug efflux pump subunit AcrA (membrane-fusion protein)
MSLHQFSDGELDRFRPLREIHAPPVIRTIAGLLEFAIFITLVILLTVPWVQTAYGPGKVISLNPNDRPQPINALVSGRIKKWYVEDGSMVKAGEPLLEIVDNDADFVERLQEQRDALARKVEAAEIGVATALLDLVRQRELYE